MNEALAELIDIPSAKERFMGNWALFSRFLFEYPDRSLYGEISDALAAEDVQKAFELAHTMKGIVGNLSLTRIFAPLSEIVETLRAGRLPNAAAQDTLRQAYEATVAEIVRLRDAGTALF